MAAIVDAKATSLAEAPIQHYVDVLVERHARDHCGPRDSTSVRRDHADSLTTRRIRRHVPVFVGPRHDESPLA